MTKKNADSSLHEQQDRHLSAKSETFIKMLQKRGIVGEDQISDEKIRQALKEKKRSTYHNTLLCLRYYRDIAWALECFPAHIAEELDKPLSDLDALLSFVGTEIRMENVKLENRLQSINKSRILLSRFNEALSVLRQKPGNGELMYKIIWETWLIPEKLSHTDIIYRLNISTRHYYRLRQQAINILSICLWSAPTAELDSWLEVLTLLEGM